MRKFYALALCLIFVLTAAGMVLGTGGEEGDPVISLSYLKSVFSPAVKEEAETAAKAQLGSVYNGSLLELAKKTALKNQTAHKNITGGRRAFGKVVLKQGDILKPLAGCKVTLLDGAVGADSTLINVTQGVPAGDTLAQKALYMQSDAASPGLSVQTATAEVMINGTYLLAVAEGTDYGSLADALSQMGLFRGMTEGYRLEGSTTRAQGLVMFLRLLGKEAEALACREPIPFTDVPSSHWAFPYVAYAYKNGLTTGVTESQFAPEAAVTAQQYMTFLLRALHYEENTQFTYNTVLADAVKLNLFTQKETETLSQGSFVRHKMVYLSYYSLFCPDGKTNRLLLEDLISAGTVTEQAAYSGLASAKGWRMGEK